jgi:drug/metabolite transporter superfamily protein YnfA
MIVYACYMGVSIVLCLIFGFFVFKKLRDQIMTSANILAIMPLEDLDTRDRQRIETFLNS